MKDKILEGLHKLVEADESEETAFENPHESEGDYSSDELATYDNIKSALDNELINHAAVIRGLWGDSDATNRSLFKKKLDGSKSDSGSKYRFSEHELGKITSILTTFRDDLGGAITKEKKKED